MSQSSVKSRWFLHDGNLKDPVLDIKIRSFTPPAAGRANVKKKLELRDAIKKKVGDIDKVKDDCRGKKLYLEVCFRLLKHPAEGRWKKDLDNMLKVLCDILPDRIVAKGTQSDDKGLGLIKEHDDHLVYKILCSKEIVETEEEEGLDLAIYVLKDG